MKWIIAPVLGDKMPGFKFTWYYSGGEVKPMRIYKDDPYNKKFARENLSMRQYHLKVKL